MPTSPNSALRALQAALLLCSAPLLTMAATPDVATGRVAEVRAELARLFADARVRIPGSPGNLLIERRIAELFSALQARGQTEFDAMSFVTGPVELSAPGLAPIPLRYLHPTLCRPGNFTETNFEARLVYLGRGATADLEALKGVSLDGTIAVMEFDCGDRWQRFLRFGVRGFVFLQADNYSYNDAIGKIHRTEVGVPRFFLETAHSAELVAAIRRSGNSLPASVRAEPARWRGVPLRNIWGLIPGSDPELERQVCVIVAPMDSNGVVPDLAEGGQAAANLYLLTRLLEEFRRRPPARTVLLAAVNAHTQGFLGERMLSWHLLAPPVAVEEVRNTIASDIRYQDLILSTYRDLDVRSRGDKAKNFLIELRTLEDRSTGRSVTLKTPIVTRVKRDVNSIKAGLLRAQREEDDPAARQARLVELRTEMEKYVHVLTLFNRVGVRTTLADLTDEETGILDRYVAETVRDNEGWLAGNRRDLETDRRNGSVREALNGRQVSMVVTLDMFWGTDRIGLSSIDRTGARDWSRRLGVNTTRIAAEFAGRAGLGESSPWTDTMTLFGGLPQDYYFPVADSAIGHFSAAANTPAVSLRNAFQDAGAAFTPADTIDALSGERVARMADYIPALFRDILADPLIMSSSQLPPAVPHTAAWTVQIRTFEFDPFSASVVPDMPVPDSIVLIQPGGIEAIVAGSVMHAYPALTDDRASRLFYGLKERTVQPLSTIAYQTDADFVGIRRVLDAGDAQEKVNSNLSTAPTRTFALFPCREVVLYDRIDPSLIAFSTIAQQKYIVLEGAQNAAPRRYGLGGISALSSKQVTSSTGPAAVYVEDRDRVKLITSEKRLAIRASPEAPEGLGFKTTAELGPDFFRRAAEDMRELNRFRVRNLRGVSNQLVDDFLRRGEDGLEALREALARGDHNAMLRRFYDALGCEVKAYEQISEITNDMLKAIVFYMALLLPFCFFVQRILFKTVRIEAQMGAFGLLFVATFLVFRTIHPAFRVARSPEAIFIAFVMGLLGLFVVWILHGRFEGEMQLIFSSYGGLESADIAYSTASQQAMMIGVHNMKRRRLRTSLTTATIVLVTFTMLAFSSISRKMSPTIVPITKEARYTGLFYQWPGSLRMDEPTLQTFLDLFSHDAEQIVVRRWFLPPKDSTGQIYPVLTTSSTGGKIELEAILGMPAADDGFLGPMPVLPGGRFFRSDDADEAVLPARAAEALRILPSDVGSATVRLHGHEYTVVGIVNDERFHAIQDMNNRPLLPIKRVQTLGWQETEQAASAKLDPTAEETGVFYADMSALLILPVQTARRLGAQPFSVSVRLKPDAPVWEAVERVLTATEAKVYLGSRGAFSISKESRRQTSAGVYFIGTNYRTSIGGLARLLIPLLIASTIILNTMLGSVYERKSEIAVYNAVGLNPTHIGIFFLAEAFVYAVVGSVGGYLIGQVLSLTLAKFHLVSDINLNFSSLSVVYVILFTIAIVLLSTLYPAAVASRAAVPSGKRKWSMPPHDGHEMNVAFPFIYQPQLVPGVAAYLAEYFARFTEASIGELIATPLGSRRTLDEEGLPVYELEYDIALAPYDLGVTQRVLFRMAHDHVVQSHCIRMTILRVSGQDTNWVTTNKPFLERLRKHLMQWRNLNPARRLLYAQDAQAWFAERPASEGAANAES